MSQPEIFNTTTGARTDPVKLLARIGKLEEALRNMTANFRSSLLLVSDRETRSLGLELVRDAERLLRK